MLIPRAARVDTDQIPDCHIVHPIASESRLGQQVRVLQAAVDPEDSSRREVRRCLAPKVLQVGPPYCAHASKALAESSRG
jgi:hypothetical protein